MILNHSKTIRSVISLLCISITVPSVGIQHFLVFYCDLISWSTPTCFSTFYHCAMVPILVENSNFFCVLVEIKFTLR